MERFKKLLPAILLILLEIAIGVLLLVDPVNFTITVYIIFGAVLMLMGVILFIRCIRERRAIAKDPEDNRRAAVLPLVAGIILFVLGAVFAFGSNMMLGVTGLMIVLYGAVMFIKGVAKLVDFFSLKSEGFSVSALRLVSGIFSIILGILILFNPFKTMDVLFVVAGIALLVEALIDIVSLIMGRRIYNALEVEAEEVGDEPDDTYDFKNFEK